MRHVRYEHAGRVHEGLLEQAPDDAGDPQDLPIATRLDGVTMQDSSTTEMVFSVAELIAFITEGITLEPGDVVLTGTPHGVGVFLSNPVGAHVDADLQLATTEDP